MKKNEKIAYNKLCRRIIIKKYKKNQNNEINCIC